jgi:cytochrome c biogenesis factor
LVKIMADQGAVLLDIPGLTDAGTGESLVMDISRKPLINLVWVGAFLVVLGSIVVFIRRREEMNLRSSYRSGTSEAESISDHLTH